MRTRGSPLKVCPQTSEGNPDFKNPLFCARECTEAIQQATSAQIDGSCCSKGGLTACEENTCKKATTMADAMIIASHAAACGPVVLEMNAAQAAANRMNPNDSQAAATQGQQVNVADMASPRKLQESALANVQGNKAEEEFV